jgi:hypothetical protein
LLSEVKGSEISEAETHEFLAHFVLLEFDFLHDGAVDPPDVMSRLRDCLAAGDVDQAPLLWTTLRQMARNSAGKAGEFDRPRLVRELARLFRLRAAPSLSGDLDKITALTRDWVADIQDDVGGTRLDRAALTAKLADALADSRFVQIRGLPGSGKSVLLRQRVEADLARGPVLFLKSDRLEGKGWTSFATTNGLSGAPLVSLLMEIAATGSDTLFIDGIDRIETDHQLIVLDILRTILRSLLHWHHYERRGTPIPVEIQFPWDIQQFWGGDREYLWHRGTSAPNALACGFMALEEWCFAELERGRAIPLTGLISP